jgi:hypothetical protein
MARSRRPSFLKRLKEQARIARATEKREARRARKDAKATAPADDGIELPEGQEPTESDDGETQEARRSET